MCQSEPGGIPGLAQGAGVDAGRGICPGGANPGLERINLAWEEIIWPGPGESWPGPAGTVRRCRPEEGNPGQAGSS
jgi:hypothetical protein